MSNELQLTHTKLAADVVAAYVSHNSVPAESLPDLIAKVFETISNLSNPVGPVTTEAPKPAVNPKRSVFPDYIICLEDGKRFKSLRRHLSTTFGMTPEDYRSKWGLPGDYPMVAPNYAAARSQLAKQIGLGRKPGQKPGRQSKAQKGSKRAQ